MLVTLKALSGLLTINIARSGRSLGFFLRHRSTKSLMSSEKTPDGRRGGGWFTMYSRSSKMAIGFAAARGERLHVVPDGTFGHFPEQNNVTLMYGSQSLMTSSISITCLQAKFVTLVTFKVPSGTHIHRVGTYNFHLTEGWRSLSLTPSVAATSRNGRRSRSPWRPRV